MPSKRSGTDHCPAGWDPNPARGDLPPEYVTAVRIIHRKVWGTAYEPGEGPMHYAGGPYWRNELLRLAGTWEREALAARRCAELLPDEQSR